MVPTCDYEIDFEHICGMMVNPTKESVFAVVSNGSVINAWVLCGEHQSDPRRSKAYKTGRPSLPLDIAAGVVLDGVKADTYHDRIRWTLQRLIDKGVLDGSRVRLGTRGPTSKAVQALYTRAVKEGIVAQYLADDEEDDLAVAS